MKWFQKRPTEVSPPTLEGQPLPQPLFLDTCALADPSLITAYRMGMLHEGVVLQSIAREIAALCTDSAHQEAGQQAARTVIVLHSLPHTQIVLDHEAPRDAHGDADLLQRAAEARGGILTVDRALQRAARERGVAVVAMQTLHAHLQPLVQELSRLAHTPPPLAPGTRLCVRITKRGEQGAGISYLEAGYTVVVTNGGDCVGQEVEVIVKSMRRNTVGKAIVLATCTTGRAAGAASGAGPQASPAGAQDSTPTAAGTPSQNGMTSPRPVAALKESA